MHPKTFIFKRYAFDADTGVLRLVYAYDNGLEFEEVITFKPPFCCYDGSIADRLFRLLFLTAGVSYYKAYVPSRLVCDAFPLDFETAKWMEHLYTEGLGEFAYVNRLDLKGKIHFEGVIPKPHGRAHSMPPYRKFLVPVGGGKDSIVTLEALKAGGFDVACFALGSTSGPAEPIADTIRVSGCPSVFVSRVISPALIELNKTGVYNGHVPITAILSVIALTAAVLYGYDGVVMSNEHSASAPNIGDINHQYSKSFNFEQDLSAYLARHVSPDLKYFSFLRPLTEVAIAKRFSELTAYHSVFRSCNTAFRQDATARGKHWCCDCPKCRFVFLALAPFMDPTPLFGKNMLDDPAQADGFAALCGISGFKPFECVGEIEESSAALKALSEMDSWKDKTVVKTLADKVQAHELDGFFALRAGHAVPAEFIRLLGRGRVAIWGTGKEGLAARAFMKAYFNPLHLQFVDEVAGEGVINEPEAMAKVLQDADIIVKSPGVSLYHPMLSDVRGKVTSLLNLWWPRKPAGKTICITGTKGKSTTSALLGHVLKGMGYKAAVLGNIGVPVSEAPEGMDYLVIELSSYQTASFDGFCDVAAVTSLYPEHLNWHGDLETYYADKLRLLDRAALKIIHPQVASVYGHLPEGCLLAADIDAVPNPYLSRPHNRANVGVVLAVIKALGLDARKALDAMADFKGLPHRQQELGERDGVLFVDDSIATTPQAAIAAMEVYAGRPVTLIAGGFDRGIDYQPLIDFVAKGKAHAVVGLGPSGGRILEGLAANGYASGYAANDMQEAVNLALTHTPQGGVLLLSPAAPSFGLFKDYIERGQKFAEAAGFRG